MNVELYNHAFASLLVGGVVAFMVSLALSVLTNLQRRVIGLLATTVFLAVACGTFGYTG